MNAPRSIGARRNAIDYLALHFAGRLDLDTGGNDSLQMIHAAGRASRLHVPGGWLLLCMPLNGCLQLESADGDWKL